MHEVLCEICFCSYEKTVSVDGALGVLTSTVCLKVCVCCAVQEMSGLECGHLFCLDCWNQYLTTSVMEEGKAEVGGARQRWVGQGRGGWGKERWVGQGRDNSLLVSVLCTVTRDT